jgi:hypothetical protein
MIDGRDVIADEYCPTGNFFWLYLDPKVLNMTINSNRNFWLRPFQYAEKQDAATAFIFLECQMVCTMPKRNARIISLSADL